MTWRRFASLLRGLGPLSGVVQRTHLRHLARAKEERVISDPKAIDAAFATLFGARRKKGPEPKH